VVLVAAAVCAALAVWKLPESPAAAEAPAPGAARRRSPAPASGRASEA